jgi:protoporphyrin/coproporphyrin ferrochelatase
VTRYDAVLLVSFGGPQGPQDVLPFLENVTRGRGIPAERLAEVGAHYELFGGVSPINAQNAALLDALRERLGRDGPALPVYWGNRNWDPYLVDAVRQMRADGVRRALAFVTAAYSSYSGCRQYRENLFDAVSVAGGELVIDKVRPYFDHPGFIEPFTDAVIEALSELPPATQTQARLVFTAHSIPTAQADASGRLDSPGGAYVAQHRATATLIADRVAAETGVARTWALVYQSRSGPPSQPWLEPDVAQHLEQLGVDRVPAAVLVPIGFVSDHMEVVYDLDVLARETADRIGLPMTRAATPGSDPRFVAMVADLVRERVEDENSVEGENSAQDENSAGAGGESSATGRPAVVRPGLSPLGPWRDVCLAGCCPNPRGPRPAVAGSD